MKAQLQLYQIVMKAFGKVLIRPCDEGQVIQVDNCTQINISSFLLGHVSAVKFSGLLTVLCNDLWLHYDTRPDKYELWIVIRGWVVQIFWQKGLVKSNYTSTKSNSQ